MAEGELSLELLGKSRTLPGIRDMTGARTAIGDQNAIYSSPQVGTTKYYLAMNKNSEGSNMIK
jgi:hypothetical protein